MSHLPNVRLASRFSHFYVTRGGAPCILVESPVAPKGILIPALTGEKPTKFICNRENDRVPSLYARRRATSAIERTEKFLRSVNGSVDPIIERLRAARGEWEVQAVKILEEEVWIKVNVEQATDIGTYLNCQAQLCHFGPDKNEPEMKELGWRLATFARVLMNPFTHDEMKIMACNDAGIE